MRRLESLAGAIASLNEYHDPSSEAYQLRNPLLLRAKTLEHLGSANDDCIRIFSCHQGGLKGGLDLLRKQCERGKRNTLRMVLGDHGHGDQFSVRAAVDFINRALRSNEVSADTELSFFLTE
jgi:hypothetical protein